MAALSLLLLGLSVLSLRVVFDWLRPGLRQIPGPFVAKFTNLWRLHDTYRNRHELTLQRLHKKYGTAVRIGPNVVSISDPEAIDSIYGFKNELIKVRKQSKFTSEAQISFNRVHDSARVTCSR